VLCGILDQFSASMGRRGHAVFLDTEYLKYEYDEGVFIEP